MKVILVNGSPKEKGSTFTGLSIIKEQLSNNGIDSEIFQVGNKPVIGCTACNSCKKGNPICAYNDDAVNTVAAAFKDADGFIIGSPVHFAAASGAATSFMDRLFYSIDRQACRMKFGASIVVCRRGGNSAAFDQLNKYFTISQMPLVSSCYWNGFHGTKPEDIYADEEGVRILRTLADNMAYLIKCKHQSNIPLPAPLPPARTDFIR